MWAQGLDLVASLHQEVAYSAAKMVAAVPAPHLVALFGLAVVSLHPEVALQSMVEQLAEEALVDRVLAERAQEQSERQALA